MLALVVSIQVVERRILQDESLARWVFRQRVLAFQRIIVIIKIYRRERPWVV
jgi:hypothetical protein